MEEIWKDIKGYEGLYQVSNLGRVRSLDREVDCMRGEYIEKRLYKGRIKKPSTGSDGYKRVHLNRDRNPKCFLIHRLVAEAFIDNTYNDECVNHKDEDKSNNIVSNLEWCTYQYNNIYNDRHIRIGSKLKGHKHSTESKEKMSMTRTGKKHSDETKSKMSIARSKYWQNKKGLN